MSHREGHRIMQEEIKERLHAYVMSKGLRHTSQRDSIVSVIFEDDDHFTVEDLLDRLRDKNIKAARATVYRTLHLLVDAGLLVEIELGDGMTTYDPNFLESPSHNHLVCIDCGHVTEFSDTHLDVLNDCLSQRMGFKPMKKSLRIEACCEKLRTTGTCPQLIEARLSSKRMPKLKR